MNIERNKALIKASEKKDLKKVMKLITLGADVNYKDTNNRTPITEALYYNRMEIVEVLLKNGAKVDFNSEELKYILYHSIESGYNEVFKFLLNNGVNPNSKYISEGGENLSFSSSLEISKLLIEHGAEVNSKDVYGYTPLIRAVIKDYKDIVELLLKNKANVNARTNDSFTALVYAKSKEVAELLIEYGANIDEKLNYGFTPLMLTNNKEIAELLIKHGAKLNEKTEDGKTPLMYALLRSDEEVAQTLIQYGDDINIIDKEGHTALTLMIVNGNSNFVELLLKNGATINYNNEKSKGYLLLNKSPKIAKLLIKYSVEIN